VTSDDRIRVRLACAARPGASDLVAALARVPLGARPVLLDGPAGEPSRHAWLCVDPRATLDDARELADLERVLARYEAAGDRPSGPFAGGFVGALAYDLGPAGEGLALPADPWGWPPILGGVYTDFVHVDRERGTTEIVVAADRGDAARRRARIEAWLDADAHGSAHGSADARPNATRASSASSATSDARRRTSSAAFRAQVEAIREAIADGDYYQANLSHRYEAVSASGPRELFAKLRRANPAPYMAHLEFDGGAICSSSPELLFDFDGRVATSRPIKGTCPRDADPERDAQARAALLASAKDRAELAMIVDLVRNDLGRVAATGGVEVPELAGLESFAHVHHLVATVRARVRRGCDAFDLLAALFPGGSITGAPKVASMRAIAALEGEGRGPFTGSLGWIGFDGAARFNILIRTLLTRPRADGRHDVSFRVGGGITHRSDPAAEDDETLAKAAGLLAALEAEEAAPR